MALFTIADLHLSCALDHPMDVFGARWQDYMKKIAHRWRLVVGENDTVVVPGDISWAMNLDGAREDFAFLNALPGKKLLGKGNRVFPIGDLISAIFHAGIGVCRKNSAPFIPGLAANHAGFGVDECKNTSA